MNYLACLLVCLFAALYGISVPCRWREADEGIDWVGVLAYTGKHETGTILLSITALWYVVLCPHLFHSLHHHPHHHHHHHHHQPPPRRLTTLFSYFFLPPLPFSPHHSHQPVFTFFLAKQITQSIHYISCLCLSLSALTLFSTQLSSRNSAQSSIISTYPLTHPPLKWKPKHTHTYIIIRRQERYI